MSDAPATGAVATPALRKNSLNEEDLQSTRVDLAACLRMAAILGMQEGVCNHFSAMMPGHDDLFLVNPYGLAFSEVTASSILLCDLDGHVVAGEGKPEPTAFYIHAELHRLRPQATAAFHTHMPNATALSMTEGDPLVWAGQTALKFFGRTAVDENFNGLALSSEEGRRIAAQAGDADILFLRNHGVMVLGQTIAQAWDDIYYLERACEVQIKAMSTGRALIPVDVDIAEKTAKQMRKGHAHSAILHLESIKRRLMASDPAFAR